MFIDLDAHGGRGEPHFETCKSCKMLIEPGHRMEEIVFEMGEKDLQKLNGFYHRECANPILEVKRVYDMIRRLNGSF